MSVYRYSVKKENMRSGFQGNLFRPHVFLCLCALWICCTYDTELPLQNYEPRCGVSEIQKVLLFPDSVVCTLTVDDLNDRFLRFSLQSDDSNSCEWAHSSRFLEEEYGPKRLILYHTSDVMGSFSGFLNIRDDYGGKLSIPYRIDKHFRDSFGSFPLDNRVWLPYSSGDQSGISFDHLDKKLLFLFGNADTSLLSAGIRSVFTVSDDFRISVTFKLRDDMAEGFEAAFFVSTSSDTGKWIGQKAGMYVSGNRGGLRMSCRSVNFQIQSSEMDCDFGEMIIRRTGEDIEYLLHDGDPSNEPISLSVHKFLPQEPIFVHMRMKVDDCSRVRSCSWKNFSVHEGKLQPI